MRLTTLDKTARFIFIIISRDNPSGWGGSKLPRLVMGGGGLRSRHVATLRHLIFELSEFFFIDIFKFFFTTPNIKVFFGNLSTIS